MPPKDKNRGSKSKKNSGKVVAKKRKALNKRPKKTPLVSKGNLVVIKPKQEKTINQQAFISNCIDLLNDTSAGDIQGFSLTVIYDDAYISRNLIPEDMATNLFSLYVQQIVKEYIDEENED
jgi:hypothetical protein